DHGVRALVGPRLVALRRLAPGRHRVTATGGLALAAAHRVVDGVHHHAAVVRPEAQVADAARLAVRDVLVLEVADLPDGGVAVDVHLAPLAAGEAHLRVAALARHQLGAGARRAHHLPALAGAQLDVVHLRAEGDLLQRQRVARVDRGVLAGHHLGADA